MKSLNPINSELDQLKDRFQVKLVFENFGPLVSLCRMGADLLKGMVPPEIKCVFFTILQIKAKNN